MLKEKQQEVDVLKKERNLERERVIKAAGQADVAEQSLSALKQEYEKVCFYNVYFNNNFFLTHTLFF